MAIIELNLEKPALKRVETVEQRRATERTAETEEMPPETEELPVEMDREGRVRKLGRRLAVAGGAAVGIVALRKLRQRRKSEPEQQKLEEDWQTTE